MAQWSRRFKQGESRYATRAFTEDDCIIITQNERIDNTKIDSRNVVVLSLDDFKKMVITLGLD